MINPAVESEKTVLGAILLDNNLLRVIADQLCPNDFAFEFHQLLFDRMIKMFNKHHAVDVAMLVDTLKIGDEDRAYIYRLAAECPSIANVKAHADIIREKSVQRQLLKLAKELNHREREKVSQKDHLVAYLEEMTEEVRNAENLDPHFLHCMLFEISKAFVSTEIGLESEEELI